MENQECIDMQKKGGLKMYSTVTVGTKGQIVIPKEVREALNINPGDNLVVVTKHNKAIGMLKSDDMEIFMEYIRKEMAN
ncbi:MAG: AbrB/MazE/SpoVT family DNA-binding domain-containing protein [Candidatus Gracilibacteria bacterium]|nr:AbrB/MazE/SpoVT family DNA-binding domain-containing protein [Candidatus Gracilibacteria bacterium]